MFCPNCGAQNSDGAGVCASCGTRLGASRPGESSGNPKEAVFVYLMLISSLIADFVMAIRYSEVLTSPLSTLVMLSIMIHSAAGNGLTCFLFFVKDRNFLSVFQIASAIKQAVVIVTMFTVLGTVAGTITSTLRIIALNVYFVASAGVRAHMGSTGYVTSSPLFGIFKNFYRE